jgi:hypothetical protein
MLRFCLFSSKKTNPACRGHDKPGLVDCAAHWRANIPSSLAVRQRMVVVMFGECDFHAAKVG